jgi:pimeloyl-ACP methyl ester carboxylesterase
MNILAARQTDYPGSAITIVETLEPGANYFRYIAWYESQGLKIYGLLTIPYGERPPTGWPAIVFNHGYIPPGVYRSTERYIAYVDQLARSGYIVYRIDYRGHDRSEGDTSGAGSRLWWMLLNAISSLQAYQTSTHSELAWGHSMELISPCARHGDLSFHRAGVIWAGVVAPTGSDLLLAA